MICRSYIDGAWLDSTASPVALGNPADCREVVSRTRYATPRQAAAAVSAAASAWESWRRCKPEQRVVVLRQLLALMRSQEDVLADAISSETGKTQTEARQEVSATLEEARVQSDILRSAADGTPGRRIAYEPLGAVLLVTPSNFPLAAVMRKLVPALLLGNTAVVKASELTPVTSCKLFELIDQSGLPGGVANLVLAHGRSVVPFMLEGNGVKAVSLTGSNATGDAIARAIGSRDIRLQAEMGGSNVVVVRQDANLDAASKAIVAHGFACCGQWCTGTTRVIVDAPVYADVVAQLARRMRSIVVGPASRTAATMGPLVSAKQRRQVEAAVAAAVESGARLVCGGKRPAGAAFEHGYFFEPTLLADVVDQSAVCRQEVFGPVLAVMQANSREEMLQKANEGPYGLSFSVYTGDPEAAEDIIGNVEFGLCHVNLPTGHRHGAMPLAGWKTSGRGTPECGRFARDFFTRTKAIYYPPD